MAGYDRCQGSGGEDSTTAPPHDYVVHGASPTREQTIPDWRDLDTPFFKGCGSAPLLRFPQHLQQPVSPPTRPSQLEIRGVRVAAGESPGQPLPPPARGP